MTQFIGEPAPEHKLDLVAKLLEEIRDAIKNDQRPPLVARIEGSDLQITLAKHHRKGK